MTVGSQMPELDRGTSPPPPPPQYKEGSQNLTRVKFAKSG